MTKVLILTNDYSLKKMIDITLRYNGFIVHFADSSEMAWKFLKEVFFDLVMVDYELNKESGLAFYKSLRQFGTTLPVLMMGEGDFDEFILRDLSPIAYDYILKPFKFRELRDKINLLMEENASRHHQFNVGDLRVDVQKGMVVLRDKIFHLGRIELEILLLLVRKAGDAVDPKKIKSLLESNGRHCHMTPFYYVSRLRNKLKKIAGESLEIILIKDEGYRLQFRV